MAVATYSSMCSLHAQVAAYSIAGCPGLDLRSLLGRSPGLVLKASDVTSHLLHDVYLWRCLYVGLCEQCDDKLGDVCHVLGRAERLAKVLATDSTRLVDLRVVQHAGWEEHLQGRASPSAVMGKQAWGR